MRSSNGRHLPTLGKGCSKRFVQDLETFLNLVGGDSDWRGQAEYTTHAGEVDNIATKSASHRDFRDSLAEIRTWRFGLSISDDLDSLQETSARDIADAPVFLLKLWKADAQLCPTLSGFLADVIALDDLKHSSTHDSREGIVQVSRQPEEFGLLAPPVERIGSMMNAAR